jgi:AcrR family transcriptional regulator
VNAGATGTANRLWVAAEALLLEKGQAATTLRDITERAGANVASVSYHYGSKDALLSDVFGSVLVEATDIQRRRLDALADDASLEDVVRVWLAPALPDPARDPRESQLWAIIHKGMNEHATGLLAHLAGMGPTVERGLVDRLAARLPHLGPDELKLRHAAVLAAMSVVAGGGGLMELVSGPLRDDTADLLVAWIVGGLAAPSAAAQRTGRTGAVASNP